MAGSIRQPIDIPALERFIAANVPEIKTPIDVKQFGYGQSNPTYQLTARDGARFVMRKKPPGKLLSKSAHQVEREYRVIHALQATNVPVPTAFCLCEDAEVIGTPFYIMEFMDGRIFEDPSFPGVTADERTNLWRAAVQTLAGLHRTDLAATGLTTFGKPTGFYNRQISTFSTISQAQAATVDVESQQPVGTLPHFDDLLAFFANPKTQPIDRGHLIHGDYKIDNLIFHKTEARVIGIIDWEMSTIGHPLSDLVNLTTPWTLARAPELRGSMAGFSDTRLRGLPSRDEVLAWYAAVAGWDPRRDMAWGEAFGLFRNACIFQGIAARHAVRQASSARAREIGDLRQPFAAFAWRTAQQIQREAGEALPSKM